MSRPLVREISHTQLPVLDLKRSFDFYLNTLGFQMKGDFGEFAVIGLDKGATIFLWVTQDQTTATFTVNGEDFPSIGIEIESMNELTNNLKQYGTEIIWATEDQEGRKFSKFYDPDGNMIVAHEEPKNIL
jgi:catechol 2,3-dioxygenase-like lactoylglutathione lyase family enzyme